MKVESPEERCLDVNFVAMVDSLYVLFFLSYLALRNGKEGIKYRIEKEADTLNCFFTEAGSLERQCRRIFYWKEKKYF